MGRVAGAAAVERQGLLEAVLTSQSELAGRRSADRSWAYLEDAVHAAAKPALMSTRRDARLSAAASAPTAPAPSRQEQYYE